MLDKVRDRARIRRRRLEKMLISRLLHDENPSLWMCVETADG